MSVLARQMQLEIRQQTAVDSTKQRGANTTKTLGPIICGCSLAAETRKNTTQRGNKTEKKITEAANLVTNASQKTEEEKNNKNTGPKYPKTLMYLRLTGQCSLVFCCLMVEIV